MIELPVPMHTSVSRSDCRYLRGVVLATVSALLPHVPDMALYSTKASLMAATHLCLAPGLAHCSSDLHSATQHVGHALLLRIDSVDT